jgi:hypothetical protein
MLIPLKKTLTSAITKAVMAARNVFKRVLLLLPFASLKNPEF